MSEPKITYTPEPPRYEHDCRSCRYLGQWNEFDLYYCPQQGLQTVVARFGKDGDYASGWVGIEPGAKASPALVVARSVAEVTGVSK